MSGPLEGIRVLDFTQLLPGAFATSLLGDLGAEVIKLERAGVGDPMRHYPPRLADTSAFSWGMDRGKRSVAVDLRRPEAVAVVLRLAEDADVAIEGWRPGVADKLGVGYDALRAVNPALVHCSLSGYGQDGPDAMVAGHDVNYVGQAGLLSLGGVDGTPVLPATQQADLAGSLLGVAGLLAALVRAQRTGQGDHVDVSLTDGAFALMPLQTLAHLATGEVAEAGRGPLTGAQPNYQVYRCADGRFLTVGALEPHFWKTVCAAVGRPDLEPTAEDPEAIATWQAHFATQPLQHWLDALAGADTCTGPVNDLAQAIADPQLRHRGLVTEATHPQAGPLPTLGSPIKLRERPAGAPGPAPALGADTRAVLVEAGYDDAAIDTMLTSGALAAPQERTPA